MREHADNQAAFDHPWRGQRRSRPKAPILQYKSGKHAGGGKAMNVQEILATLKKLGKRQTAAIYKRHGAGDNVFGVLTSEIARLQKKIKVDHGETNCKTPDAAPYIEKASKRKRCP